MTFKNLNAFRIPWRAQIKDSLLCAILSQTFVFFDTQLKPVQQVDDIFSAEIFTIFGQTALPIDLVQMAHLKFGAIGPGRTSEIHHLHGALNAAVLVVPDFCNDKGATSADVKSAYLDIHASSYRWLMHSRTVQACNT